MSEFILTPKIMSDGLPRRVKIGPIEYEIVEEPSPVVKNPEDEDIPVFGKISFKEEIITIDSELAPSTKWQCYFHECVHALLETVGMGGAEFGLGEGAVDALAYGLMSFLLDNGFLAKFPAPESFMTPKPSTVFPYPYTMEKKG